MWREAILPQNQNRFDKMREYRRERFLEMDQARLIGQFHLEAEAPFSRLMSIYHLSCYSKPELARPFDGRLDALRRACEARKGEGVRGMRATSSAPLTACR